MEEKRPPLFVGGRRRRKNIEACDLRTIPLSSLTERNKKEERPYE